MFKKLLTLGFVLVAVAACQSTPTSEGAAGGRSVSGDTATYADGSSVRAGSQEDFEKFVGAYVGDRVFFALDSSVVNANGQATLARQAEWLKLNPSVTVTIEGHADERGTREYNLALGERRANAVRKYLTSLGIDRNRVSTISFGKERPEVLGSDESAWSKNRRGVTKVN